jgi:hypothetical protein
MRNLKVFVGRELARRRFILNWTAFANKGPAWKNRFRHWRPVLSPMFLLLFLACLSGCVGYRLGSTLPPDVKKVYVPLFLNKSREPLIENDATAATIAELQKDGTLKVVNAENADVILECTLTAVSLNPLRYDRTDVTKPNEYRITLAASFTLKRIGSQELLCEASVIGEATFPFVGNLVSAKQSAMPQASEDLAKRIVEKAVEAW